MKNYCKPETKFVKLNGDNFLGQPIMPTSVPNGPMTGDRPIEEPLF